MGSTSPRSESARSSVSAKVVIDSDVTTVRARHLPLDVLAKHVAKRAREESGHTQDSLAACTGVSQQLIAAHENERKTNIPNLSHLLAVPTDVFDATIRGLLAARQDLHGEPERRLIVVTKDCADLEAKFAKLLNATESLRHQAAEVRDLSEIVGRAVSK